MRFLVASGVVAALLACGAPLRAQAGDPKMAIQRRLTAEFALTIPTADLGDIVRPGSVVMLQRPGMLMFPVADGVPPLNTYKGDKIVQTFGSSFSAGMKLGQKVPGLNLTNVPKRKCAVGEKFWVTAISVVDDGVVIQLYSDPYEDGRYFGEVKFPYAKNAIPPADQIAASVADVLSVQGGDQTQQQAGAEPPPPPQPAPQPALAPIAPPPPPPDAAAPPPTPVTKTIALGQTREQVVGTFGPPQKVVKLGAKEIDYYADMKVTFTNGKVSNVE